MSDSTASLSPGPKNIVSDLLDDAVVTFPDRPALDFLGRQTNYAELGRLVEQAAAGLQRLGVRKGTRVGLCMPNTPYFVIFYYAALKAGAIVVNFNPLYVERELKHQIKDSGTTVMVTVDIPQLHAKLAHALDTTCLAHVVVCPMAGILPEGQDVPFPELRQPFAMPQDARQVHFDDLVDRDGLTHVAVDPARDPAVLQYTGGTTGVPKAAVLTHANLLGNVRQLLTFLPEMRPGEETTLVVLPLFHVFAMTVGMNLGIAAGAKLVLVPRFEVEHALRCIAETRPTMFPGVPTLYTAINTAAEKIDADLSSIRWCISGGAPLPLEVRSRFEQLTGCRLMEGYGLSEASPVVTCNLPRGKVKAGSIGLPLPDTIVEIHSPILPGKILPIGEKGEICVRGAQVMQGYWNRPEETRAVLSDGLLRTGDIGYVDMDGYVFLVERIKDVILCGGYNVYPRIIEEALYRHPAVAEAAVIAIPDAYRGQAPKAYVRLRDGQTVSVDELKTFLAEFLSPIEMPKIIEFRAQLPKTTVGKLAKKELEAEANNAAAPSSSPAN